MTSYYPFAFAYLELFLQDTRVGDGIPWMSATLS